jgi:long-subunit acyl-CoA synthetase (AMP-forming)
MPRSRREAPVRKEILELFDACGVLLLGAYGLTEACAASTISAAAH